MKAFLKTRFKNKVGMALLKRINRMQEMLSEAPEVRVGWFKGQRYPNGEQIADVAFKQEYGTSGVPGIPSRPFMRVAERNRGGWKQRLSREIRFEFKKKESGDISKAFERVGYMVKEDIQIAILSVHEPPLRPYTVRKRAERLGLTFHDAFGGNERNSYMLTKPLIDTGTMITSIEVRTYGKNRSR
jgi:hypothetical protein